MECPTTGGQLQGFVCAMQWLSSAIPQFQDLLADLSTFLETVYTSVSKQTKPAVSRGSLAGLRLTATHTAAFEACKNTTANRVTLAHRYETERLCINTNASDSHCSGIITQVPRDQLSLPYAEQSHEPLAFHSSRFSTTHLGWLAVENEAFVVLASIERSHCLASCSDGFDLYTDHSNMIFIFDPLSVAPNLRQAAVRKVLRWAVRLSAYKYVCLHIKGEDCVWAVMPTRWSIPLTIRHLVSITLLPTTIQDFKWPALNAVQESQGKHATSRSTNAVYANNS